MQSKKNPEVDLEKKRGLYLQIGFIISLLLVLAAFEYKSYDKTDSSLGELNLDDLEEEIIPITKQEVKPPPPPPPPPEIIEVVENDVEIEEEVEIEETETDEEEAFEIPEEEDDEEIFMVVEQAPEFPCMKFGRKKELCGFSALTKYLQDNVEYPTMAKEYDITGKVFVQFVVEKNGKVTNVKLQRGVDKSLDEEALRVVKSFPDWNPGKQRGKAVRVYFTVPINFNLN